MSITVSRYTVKLHYIYTCIIICPIAIAGTDNKIGLRLSVCPCVVTLTVAFLSRFSPNWTQRCKPLKVRTSSLGSISPHPFPYFSP